MISFICKIPFENQNNSRGNIAEQLLNTKPHTHQQGGDTGKQYGNFYTRSFKDNNNDNHPNHIPQNQIHRPVRAPFCIVSADVSFKKSPDNPQYKNGCCKY
jgi:hypothetical protein